jgi:hypothetical protein
MDDRTICTRCGRGFFPVLATHTICRTCYFEKQRNYDMALAEEAWRKGFSLGYTRGHAAGTEKGEPLISLTLLESAIKLCHPDWHPPARFQRANAITTELLAARARLKAIA